MSKKLLIFIVMFNLINVNGVTLSEIIPLKKPTQTNEETQKKLLIDILKPLPKPINNTKKKVTKEKVVEKKEKKSRIILPKKKPLIAGISETEKKKRS